MAGCDGTKAYSHSEILGLQEADKSVNCPNDPKVLMPIDFTAPAFFDVMRHNKGHEASSYLVTLAALAQGLSVTFFRSQREAGLKKTAVCR